MSKYIIRNCPSAIHNVMGEREIFFCASAKNENLECQNCTDCVLKQIVELCKKVQKLEYQKGGVKYKSPSKAKFGREILQLLDIQEVE